MKNTQVAAATKNARRTSTSSAATKKTAKPTRPQTGLKKRRGPFLRESATRHTSQKPPLECEVVDLLARRCTAPPRVPCTSMAAILVVIAVLVYSSADAAPVQVRFLEGVTHGYLVVRSQVGETIGQGELTQAVKEGDLVETRMVIRFKDGSLYDEKVAFSQQRVFTIIRYHLIQQGPSFPEQLDVSIDRGTAEYKIRSQAGQEGKEEVRTGHFDLPNDVYNGMFVLVLKNLLKDANATVNLLAFTPEPTAIKVQVRFIGEQTVHIGDLSSKAKQYVFKPQIGKLRQFFGKLAGKLPADFHYHCWILAGEVPGFVQFEGPLQLMGPIVRIELVSPRLLAKP